MLTQSQGITLPREKEHGTVVTRTGPWRSPRFMVEIQHLQCKSRPWIEVSGLPVGDMTRE